MKTDKYFATTPKGMADLLAAELTGLGIADVRETRAGVEFSGDLEAAYRVCLWSRLANRMLLPLASFHADSPEALYDGVRGVNWQQHLTAEQTLAVDANVTSSAMTHGQYVALKVKDAVVDSFTDRGEPRPSVDVAKPDIRLNCYVHRNEVSLYLDLSGASLHQRNYRVGTGSAPLKENLAAAILMRARWAETLEAGGALVDLMCGSGTLIIEGALIAADIAPALGRDYFGFLGWLGHQDDIWQQLLAEARDRRRQGIHKTPPLMGFDHNRKVLDLARRNAAAAGVDELITFAYQDITSFRHDFPDTGLMVTNPPYGKRLSETGELEPLYKALGEVMRRNLKGWRAALFIEDQHLGKHIGIKANKLHTLYNGAIPCKLIHFNIEEDQFYRDGRLPRPVPPEEITEQGAGFRNRLAKNLKQTRKWAKRESVTAYRVYDADLPDYSAAIDVYESAASSELWVNIQEYQAPDTIDPRKAKFRSRELVSLTRALFAVDDQHLFFRTRSRQRGDAQYERMASEAQFHEVQEANIRLRVNFVDYLDTGLFLDHRPIRQRIAEEASGKDFLNLFAYTGAATVHAASGGAASTTTVDMSRTYLDWAQKNLALNGFTGKDHVFVQEDCLQWLAGQKTGQYDLIFLDPPSFSNSKRMDETFDVQRDHESLIRAAARLLRADGTLYFSTNLRKFRLSQALADRENVIDISADTIPFDFKRRQNIHHTFQIGKLD